MPGLPNFAQPTQYVTIHMDLFMSVHQEFITYVQHNYLNFPTPDSHSDHPDQLLRSELSTVRHDRTLSRRSRSIAAITQNDSVRRQDA